MIAEEVISRITTISKLSRQLNLPKSTLHGYVRKPRKEETIEAGHGRPRSLDKDSINSIFNSIEEHPQIGTEQLEHRIAQEYVATHKRRSIAISDDDEDVEISRRTLNRYLELFQETIV